MSRFLQIRDQYSRIFGRRFLNSQLSLYIGLLQLGVCVWALLQHVYSIVNFNKILFCDFNANSSLPMAFAGVDAIIFDIGLFHSLWGIDGCVAEHLDGGYGRFGWCVTHIMVLVMCLPCAFLNRPRPFLLWPLLIQQSIYGIGLLILSLAALPRILPTFMGDLNNAPMTAIFAYVIGMCMNFFLLYVYWHWYWHVEAEWDSSRKLRDDEITPTVVTRTPQTQRKQPILTQPGGENGSVVENGGLKKCEKVVKVDDEGHAPTLRSNFSNGQVNGHVGNGIGFGGKMGENRKKVSLLRTNDNSATIIRQDPPTRVQALVNGLAREFVADHAHQDIIHQSFGHQEVETPILIDEKSRFKPESPQGSTASSVYSASAMRKPKTLEGKLTLSRFNESPDSSLSLSINSNIPPRYEYESNSTTATPLSNATTSRLRQDRRKFDDRKLQNSADLHHGPPSIVAPNSTPVLPRSLGQNTPKMTSDSPKLDVLPRTLAQSRMRMLRKYQSTENYSPISRKKSQLSQSAHNSFVEENTYDRVHTPSEGTLNSEVETPTAEVASRKDTVESRVSSELHRPAIFPGRPLDPSPASYDDFLRESRLAQWTPSPTVLRINPALAHVHANGAFRQSSLDNNLVRRSGGYGSDPEAPRRSNYGQFSSHSTVFANSARVGNDLNRLQNGFSNHKGIYSNRQHYSNPLNTTYSNPSTSYSNQKIVDYSIPEGPEYRDLEDRSYSTPLNESYSNRTEIYSNSGKIYNNLPNGYSSPKLGLKRTSDGYSNPGTNYSNPGKSYSNPPNEAYSTPPPPSNGYSSPYSPCSRTPVPAPAPSPYGYQKQPLGPKGSLDSRLYSHYQTGL
ncbi:unnamed protein product [Bursaphelenchus xylophilus]|uniref:(pine wood nematode) hypothetical protein n=1 Tax=Bursaphelenchus xylophilus TaxID=6326 RepID=A0A1I7S703_BURXY|nr:unnamed protein product [Bursaphelenchus xylophilus]CAG9079494.1 unnamed protein product [Bursaphelenchus xylophilus]